MIRRQILIGIGTGLAVVVVDLLTKRLAASAFADERLTVIPGVLWFTYTENFGAAFSMLQDAGVFLSIAAVTAIVIVLNALREERPLVETIAFGLIGGGAAGNLIDRIARGDGLTDGGVIDWIQLPNFPVFNVADSSITVAVVLLLGHAWLTERRERVGAT